MFHNVAVGVQASALAVDGRARHVLVATAGPFAPGSTDFPVFTERGHVSVVGSATGRLVHRIESGVGPSTIDIDTRIDCVFILDTGRTVEEHGRYRRAAGDITAVDVP